MRKLAVVLPPPDHVSLPLGEQFWEFVGFVFLAMLSFVMGLYAGLKGQPPPEGRGHCCRDGDPPPKHPDPDPGGVDVPAFIPDWVQDAVGKSRTGGRR